MTKLGEEAVRLFRKSYSCSQALLAVYGRPFGLERELALRLAGAFGAGMARRGDICGIITGAMMVLGLKFGMVDAGDLAAKEKCYARAQEFISRFQARHGSILCRDLLGVDLGTPDGQEKNREQKLSAERCPAYIREAAELLESMLL